MNRKNILEKKIEVGTIYSHSHFHFYVISDHGRDNLNYREGKRTLITDTSIIYYCKALYNWNIGIIEYMSTYRYTVCLSLLLFKSFLTHINCDFALWYLGGPVPDGEEVLGEAGVPLQGHHRPVVRIITNIENPI